MEETERERAKMLDAWLDAAEERRRIVEEFASQFSPSGLSAFVGEAERQRAAAREEQRERLAAVGRRRSALDGKLAFRDETAALVKDLESAGLALRERIDELRAEERADAARMEELMAFKAGKVRKNIFNCVILMKLTTNACRFRLMPRP